jgi:hypothetical protein
MGAAIGELETMMAEYSVCTTPRKTLVHLLGDAVSQNGILYVIAWRSQCNWLIL